MATALFQPNNQTMNSFPSSNPTPTREYRPVDALCYLADYGPRNAQQVADHLEWPIEVTADALIILEGAGQIAHDNTKWEALPHAQRAVEAYRQTLND